MSGTIYATWLADVLRAAGRTVVEHDGWQRRGAPNVRTYPERAYPGGGFAELLAVVWHHDASPRGDSPGVPAYMLGRWEVAAAQLWVTREGVWHVLAAGVAWHAGAVLPGMPGNWTSLGVETDHTIGEDWPDAQLDSLRTGTAAILHRLNRSASAGLHFHKTICDPPGRKPDPATLDLDVERRSVQIRIDRIGGKPAPALKPAPVAKGKPAPKVPAFPGVVRRGSRGAAVRAFQARLKARGWRVGVDGIFGPETESVVRAYQAEKGLGVDGIAGPLTWRSLWAAPITP